MNRSGIAAAGLIALTLTFTARARADEIPSPEEARAHETVGDFAEAATELEAQVALLSPSSTTSTPRARAWIERAITYRFALGDDSVALRDVQQLARWTTDRERVAEVELDVASIFERAGRWADSVRFHEQWLREHERDASPRLRVRALVELGDARRESGDARRAQADYQRAIAMSPPDAERETAEGDPWLARALFRQTEPRFQAFMATTVPPYTGGDSRRAFDTWSQRVLTPFVNAQRGALNRLTQEYSAVASQHDTEWEMAAFHHLAAAYGHFWSLVQSAPVAPDIARNPDLIDAYRSMAGCDPNRTFWSTAIEGFQRCVHRATALRQTGVWLQRCERSLSEIDRFAFPVPDEITPSPDQGLGVALEVPSPDDELTIPL